MKQMLAMNLLLWGTEMNSSMFPILEEIKQIGYDAVEIPIFETDEKRWRSWKQQLDMVDLKPIAVTINGPEHHAIGRDQTMRRKTLERNKRALDCAAILESGLLTGPFHSALGVFSGLPATPQEKEWAADHLYQLSEYAATLNITLGLEYLNRFESYLVSCTEELMHLVESVNHPHCKVMMDTFHANIEETKIEEAIKRMGQHLVHVQLSENDRGVLGKGHIDFPSILQVLDEINYSRAISIEAFSTKLTAANIWRPLFESEIQLAKDSYKYVRSL